MASKMGRPRTDRLRFSGSGLLSSVPAGYLVHATVPHRAGASVQAAMWITAVPSETSQSPLGSGPVGWPAAIAWLARTIRMGSTQRRFTVLAPDGYDRGGLPGRYLAVGFEHRATARAQLGVMTDQAVEDGGRTPLNAAAQLADVGTAGRLLLGRPLELGHGRRGRAEDKGKNQARVTPHHIGLLELPTGADRAGT